mmetsp:Transcript_2732/g.5821  ORF Transcript_2732/g.5821 Transcript_2732/m.5821 type:complete len:210 (-) Transcript_2732:674-1303(-)
MKERFTTEHSGELFTYTLEHFLYSGGVSNEGTRHLQSLWRDITHGGFDVVWDPFNKVRRVLVLNVEHLLVNFLGGHASAEDGGCSQVSSMARVCSTHHVLCIECLLGKFWYSQSTVLLGSTGGKWREPNHEKVKTWEWNQVDSQLSEVRVQLTRESKAACTSRHCRAHQVVKVSVGWSGQFEGTEANIVKCLVIQNHDFISVFHQLMYG